MYLCFIKRMCVIATPIQLKISLISSIFDEVVFFSCYQSMSTIQPIEQAYWLSIKYSKWSLERTAIENHRKLSPAVVRELEAAKEAIIWLTRPSPDLYAVCEMAEVEAECVLGSR